MTNQTQIVYNVSLNKHTKSISFRINTNNNIYIVHRAIVKELHEKRQGNASSKTKSQVRGGGKKPWKQKGTGKARAGSIRSPLWRGGGVIFGPTSQTYIKKLNRKEKQLALRNLIYNKKNETIIINESYFQLEKASTNLLINKIQKLNINITSKILIIVTKKNTNTYLSIRNLTSVDLIAANQLNLLAIIQAKHLIITEDSLDIIQRTYNE